MSTLIWGRLDTGTASGLSVSLPEACRLSDALAIPAPRPARPGSLRAEITERIRQLRAQMERIREQIDLEPAGTGAADRPPRSSRGWRGGSRSLPTRQAAAVTSPDSLGPVEIEAATFERDLIVNGARRRDAAALLRRAREERAELEAREAALREHCRRSAYAASTRRPATRYPMSRLLGQVPNTRDELEAYLRRLDQVSRAMAVAQNGVHQGAA